MKPNNSNPCNNCPDGKNGQPCQYSDHCQDYKRYFADAGERDERVDNAGKLRIIWR